MNYKVGDIVEVEGSQDDPGFRDSWSQYKVTQVFKRRSVIVQSLEFLAGETDDSGPLTEVKSVSEIRPQLEDDSLTCPLASRRCGDAVDVFKDGCWWTGRVCKCYDDHFTVMFPNAEVEEEPYRVWVPPREPECYCARTAKEFDAKNVSWLAIPRVWYSQCHDYRASHTAMLPQRNDRKRLVEPVSQECSEKAAFAKDSMEISHKRQAQGMCGYGQTFVAIEDMVVGSSKGNALGSKHVDKELSNGHASRKAKPRRQVSKLQQDKPSQAKDTSVRSQGHVVSKAVSPQTIGAALLEDDIIMGAPPQRHKSNNHALNLACLVNQPSLHGASETSCGVHLGGKANRARDDLDVLPHTSTATGTYSGPHKLHAQKAKPIHGVAPSPSKLCKTTAASMAAQEEDEQTTSPGVVEATNRGLVEKDKCLRPDRSHSIEATHHLSNPPSAKRWLEPSGSSNDRRRALPKAACFLRGLKGQEDEGLESVPSNLSQASLSSKSDHLSEDVGASCQLKAKNDVRMGIHAFTSRRHSRSKESFARKSSKNEKLLQSNVLCIDFLGSLLEGASLEVELRKLVDGLEEVVVANIVLENGVHEAGWAAAHFASIEDASIAFQRLQFLFLQTQDVPFPMPLLVHPPNQASYPWGPNFYSPGSVVTSGTCHFMQPNSLEFRPAQEWRTLDLLVAEWKRAMRELHQCELEEVIQAFVDGLDDGISCLNGVKMSSPNSTRPATQLWLKGLLPSQDSVKDVALAFQQWIDTSGTSSECAVKLIIDPVTRTFNGHAVVNMKSADQATWVMKDLNDMLFVVSTGPRPIQASMAMAGGPFGAMATLDNAKRAVFGNLCNNAKVVAPQLLINEEPKDRAQVVAHTLRHLLLQHSEQRAWLSKKVHGERQSLHFDHKRMFEEEFGKYMRATKVNRSISMQSVKAPKDAMKRLRDPPNLSTVLVDRNNS